MTLIGILLAVVGIAGAALMFFNIVPWTGLFGDIRIWVGIAVVGGVIAMLTRRPSD